jgi:hypothetical protein
MRLQWSGKFKTRQWSNRNWKPVASRLVEFQISKLFIQLVYSSCWRTEPLRRQRWLNYDWLPGNGCMWKRRQTIFTIALGK